MPALSEVIELIQNGTTKTQNKEFLGLPVTRIETIASESINAEKVGYINDYTDSDLHKYLLKEGDILISHINSLEHLGKTALYEGAPSQLLHGMNLLLIRPNQGICNPHFLNFQFKFLRNKGLFASIAGRAVGQASINQGNMKSIEINLPPLPEQKAIAQVLRAVQQTKTTRQKELTLERERKAALMDHLFTHGTRNEPLKQTEIGEIPESWEVKEVKEIATIASGGTPSREKSEYWNGDIPWVKTGEINWNVIYDTEEKITEEGLNNSAAKIIKAGTILMAMYGQGVTRGRVAILGIDASLNQACAAFTQLKDVTNEFLFYFLTHQYEKIRNYGHGANQKNLNSDLIKRFKVAFPSSEDEQNEISGLLRACDTKMIALEKEIQYFDELFQALLEELMMGRLSVEPLLESNKELIAV